MGNHLYTFQKNFFARACYLGQTLLILLSSIIQRCTAIHCIKFIQIFLYFTQVANNGVNGGHGQCVLSPAVVEFGLDSDHVTLTTNTTVSESLNRNKLVTHNAVKVSYHFIP